MLKTVPGAIVTLFIALVLIAFGVNKHLVMHSQGGVSYSSVTQNGVLDNSVKFMQDETHVNAAIGFYNKE